MPRTISNTSLAKLTAQYGTEPINILEIQWVAGGQRLKYADRDATGGIMGRILSISGLDDVVDVSGGSQSQQISVVMDDTDGSLKGILDNNDVHKRPCWVYQWFNGIDPSEKFLIFKGEISSPLEWDEGARTISFDVISKIEDVEVGFSIEEGDFIDPPEELIGQPWPLCFGTVINVPALRTQSPRQGILAAGVGIRDFTLEKRLQYANAIVCPENFVGFKSHYASGDNPTYTDLSVIIEPVYETDASCLQSKCEAIEELNLELTEQKQYEYKTVRIFGGDKFPQNKRLTLNINGGKFIGSFNGEIFTIVDRIHPDYDPATGNVKQTDTQKTIQSHCGAPVGSTAANAAGGATATTDGVPGKDQVLLANKSKATWDAFNAIKAATFFWANAGATVTIDSDQEIVYICNILPSTVLRVAAWRDLDASHVLLTVPDSYYTVRQSDFTTYQVCEVVFNRPLSTRAPGWSDDIFITLTSSVGPNTVDIIEWFITTYTGYSIDSTSFAAVRTKVDNYPMHFPLLERKNIIEVLQEIAFQARCALWLKDDVFYIKYLPDQPTADDTIAVADIDANSLKITHTPTEELVTKFKVEWKKDYAIDNPNLLILRHNVSKYGTHEGDYNFYCFNIIELVRKAATFWLIRKANTWRRVVFNTAIHKLKNEVFDTLGLTIPSLSPNTIKGIVEKANFDSANRLIEFECWTPVKSGTTVAYDFAYPGQVDETAIFPTLGERNAGFAGAGTGPNFSVIAPNGHPLSNQAATLPTGFQLSCVDSNGNVQPVIDLIHMGCRSDFGDRTPSDIGDHKPTPNATSDQNGAISVGTSPVSAGNGEGSNCCAAATQALATAQQALKEAQQARSEAQQANQNAGNDKPKKEDNKDDALKKLPSTCGGTCQAKFKVIKIIPTLITFPPGSDRTFGNEPGDKGALDDGTQTTSTCYTFNSMTALKQVKDAIQAEISARGDNYGWTVGQEDFWLITDVDPDLGSDKNGNPCPEPDGEDQSQTGYQPDVKV